MFSETAASIMLQKLPEGYEIITEGILIPGDIRWNRWADEWNTTDITASPKHDCVIGDPIKSFAGVCRKRANQLKQAV
jgi:hypothetical protein